MARLMLVILLIGSSCLTRGDDISVSATAVDGVKNELDTEVLLPDSTDQPNLQTLLHRLQVTEQQLQVLQQELRNVRRGRRDVVTPSKPRDCAEVMADGATRSGVYTVYIGSKLRPLNVYCDMTTDGGGWLVFQRRSDGTVDFQRTWTDYATGFGNLEGEFWLGNNALHSLTASKQYELRIDLGDWYGNTRYAVYTDFKVGSALPCENYKLTSLGTYCGNAGDSLSYHVGRMFSTADKDNDPSTRNCAANLRGAWWYNNCHYSNLNGAYLRGPHTMLGEGVNWLDWTGYYYSLKHTEMKIRPSDL